MEEAKQREMMKLFAEFRTEANGWLGFETKRNTENIDLFEAMIRESYEDVTMVVAGHHIMFMCAGQPAPYEVASADTLIFNNDVAKRLWKERYQDVLMTLAKEPAASRDVLLRKLYFERG